MAGAIDTLVVATGGGGFTAGQAAWFQDRVQIVSVEPEISQCLRAALAAGAPVPVPVSGLAADSLGAKQVGAVPWQIVRRFVDDAVTVPDDDISAAQRALWDDLRLVVEPGGAAALAAIRSRRLPPRARRAGRRGRVRYELRPVHGHRNGGLIVSRGRGAAACPAWRRCTRRPRT